MVRAGLLVVALGSLAAVAGWRGVAADAPAHVAAQPTGLEGLRAADPAVRAEAACAAGRLGSPSADGSVTALITLLGDTTRVARTTCGTPD